MSKIKSPFTDEQIDLFYQQEDHAGEVNGFVFEALVPTHSFDDHGSVEYKLAVKRVADDKIFVGLIYAHPGEGFLTDAPSQFKLAQRVEKTVVVVDYI
jgi:hypothetical protein